MVRNTATEWRKAAIPAAPPVPSARVPVTVGPTGPHPVRVLRSVRKPSNQDRPEHDRSPLAAGAGVAGAWNA